MQPIIIYGRDSCRKKYTEIKTEDSTPELIFGFVTPVENIFRAYPVKISKALGQPTTLG